MGGIPDVLEVSNFVWYLQHGNRMGKQCQLIKIPHFVSFNSPNGDFTKLENNFFQIEKLRISPIFAKNFPFLKKFSRVVYSWGSQL